MKAQQNNYVEVTYTLIVGENDGEATVMEQATKERPFRFIFGMNMLLPKFEEGLLGKEIGESFDIKISPADAYGEYEEERVVNLSLDLFKDENGKIDTSMVAPDHTLPMMDNEGNVMHGTVVEVTDNHVKMDFNHPLAGEELHFVGEVIESREATLEEMAKATQPHHCGGNCGGCKGCHSDGADDDSEGGCCGGKDKNKEGGCCGGNCNN